MRRVMDRSTSLDDFMKKLGTEPTSTQVRLFIDYKSLIGKQRESDRWVGERYLTREDFARLKELGLRISSFIRNGKSVRMFRDSFGRFVSSKILEVSR